MEIIGNKRPLLTSIVETEAKRPLLFGDLVKFNSVHVNSKCCTAITGVPCLEEKETWKSLDFFGFPLYFISNHGVIKDYEGKFLNKNGWMTLKVNKKQVHFSVHKLVLEAFVDKSPFLEQFVLFYDNVGGKNNHNYHLQNLCWFPGKKQKLELIQHLIHSKLDGISWKPLDAFGYIGYKASDTGTIYNSNNIALPGSLDDHGYLYICIRNQADSKSQRVSVHSLIALAFLPHKPSPTHTINHINRIRDDNDAINLRWATPSEQSLNQDRPAPGCIAGRSVIKMDLQGNFLQIYPSFVAVALSFNITNIQQPITNACENHLVYRNHLWKFYKSEQDADFKEWRKVPIEGIDCYASNHGCVRIGNIDTFGSGDENGYLSIGFTINGDKKSFLVHRLIALAFLGTPPDSKMVANHKDLDKQNNDIANLEYITQRENVLHFIENTDEHPHYKRPVRQYKAFQFVQEFASAVEGAIFTKCDAGGIGKVCRGDKGMLVGFQFVYSDTDYIEHLKTTMQVIGQQH